MLKFHLRLDFILYDLYFLLTQISMQRSHFTRLRLHRPIVMIVYMYIHYGKNGNQRDMVNGRCAFSPGVQPRVI